MRFDHSGMYQPYVTPSPAPKPKPVIKRITHIEMTGEQKKASRKLLILFGTGVTLIGGIYIAYYFGYLNEWQMKRNGLYDYWRYSIGDMTPDEHIEFGTVNEFGEMRPRMVW